MTMGYTITGNGVVTVDHAPEAVYRDESYTGIPRILILTCHGIVAVPLYQVHLIDRSPRHE